MLLQAPYSIADIGLVNSYLVSVRKWPGVGGSQLCSQLSLMGYTYSPCEMVIFQKSFFSAYAKMYFVDRHYLVAAALLKDNSPSLVNGKVFNIPAPSMRTLPLNR